MGSFRPKLTFLFALFVFALRGSAQADKAEAQIEKFYIVNKDDPATGGCTPDQVQYLHDAYTEAIMMIRGAIRDIDTFNDPRSKDNVEDQQQYDKISIMLAQIFGIRTVDEDGGPKDRDERIRLTTTRDVLKKLQENADGPIPTDPQQKKVILCNDNGITVLRNNDRIPTGERKGELASVFRAPHGVLFQPGKYDEKGNQVYSEMTLTAPPPRTPESTPRVHGLICGASVLATTHRASGRIICCPRLFNKIAPLAGVNVKRYMPLDKLSSGSRVLIHKLVHLWLPIGDRRAVDMSPSLSHPRPKMADPNQLVYSFDRCCDLADNYPSETVQTAETFAVFATGQFYRDWIWVTVKTLGNKVQKGIAWPITEPHLLQS